MSAVPAAISINEPVVNRHKQLINNVENEKGAGS
jgi:hypothetical protein